jgi:hypothetical protein
VSNIEEFIDMTVRGTPWGFAGFTAGAMNAVAGEGTPLRTWLIAGLQHRQTGFWLGCPAREAEQQLFDRLVEVRYRQVIGHHILHHTEAFREAVECYADDRGDRPVMWIGGEPPFKVDHTLKVGGWEDFDAVRRLKFPTRTLAMVDAGLTGTCLAWQWYKRNPRCTILDVKGVWSADLSSSVEADPDSIADSQTLAPSTSQSQRSPRPSG